MVALINKINASIRQAIEDGKFYTEIDLCTYTPSEVLNQIVEDIRAAGITCKGGFTTKHGDLALTMTVIWGNGSEHSDNYQLL